MPDPDKQPHIVDTLIKERAPSLARSPLWPVVRPALYALLDYRPARDMADAIEGLSGRDALEYVSDLLDLNVDAQGLKHVPEEGRCIIATNHPTGVADGVAMYDALCGRRPDLAFFASADALRVCEGFEEMLIPVEWPPEERTLGSSKETLRAANEALDDERPVVIYPSGRVARRTNGGVRDTEWENSAVALAHKHEIPLIPAYTDGPYPRLFHLFDRLSSELRDITLFHELLNKKGGDYRIVFGPPIAPEALEGEPDEVTRRLKAYVEDALAASPEASFP